MGIITSRLFGLIQGADFYWQLHRQAVALLPPGQGKMWFDIGCGPGLVAQLARAHGYRAAGFDQDAAMVRHARTRSAGHADLSFVHMGLASVVTHHGRGHVVSVASLLYVVPDRRAALVDLLDAVGEGGTLLVVETSAAMAALPTSFRASDYASGHRAWILRLWVRARRHREPVDVVALCPPGHTVEQYPLLGGLVNAWLVRRNACATP